MIDNKKLQTIGFFILWAVVGLLVALIWWPFWQILALAGIVAVLFSPIYERLNQNFKSPGLAAATSAFLVILIIVLPLWLFGQVLFNELVDVYNKFKMGELSFSSNTFYNHLSPQMQSLLNGVSNDVVAMFSKLTSGAFTFIQKMLSNLAIFFMSLFILVFSVFYLLKDSKAIKAVFIDLSPLPADYQHKLVTRIEEAIAGVVKGSFLIALIQGVVGIVGFFIFGVPQPFLWGAAIVIASMVPTVGTALVLIPAVLYLFFVGHTSQALGLVIWGALVVGLVDNFVSPKLIGKNLKMHPLLALLSVIGGIQLFGFLGFLFGPIIMAIFLGLVEIYRTDLKK